MVLDKKFIIKMCVICGIYIVLSPIVFLIVNDSLHIMLGWNLLLAFVPFLIAIFIDAKKKCKDLGIGIVISCLALVFSKYFLYDN